MSHSPLRIGKGRSPTRSTLSPSRGPIVRGVTSLQGGEPNAMPQQVKSRPATAGAVSRSGTVDVVTRLRPRPRPATALSTRPKPFVGGACATNTSGTASCPTNNPILTVGGKGSLTASSNGSLSCATVQLRRRRPSPPPTGCTNNKLTKSASSEQLVRGASPARSLSATPQRLPVTNVGKATAAKKEEERSQLLHTVSAPTLTRPKSPLKQPPNSESNAFRSAAIGLHVQLRELLHEADLANREFGSGATSMARTSTSHIRVYQKVFEEAIERNETYAAILRKIKQVYDSSVSQWVQAPVAPRSTAPSANDVDVEAQARLVDLQTQNQMLRALAGRLHQARSQLMYADGGSGLSHEQIALETCNNQVLTVVQGPMHTSVGESCFNGRHVSDGKSFIRLKRKQV